MFRLGAAAACVSTPKGALRSPLARTLTKVTNDPSKYLHPQSIVPTLHFQKSLPRLKIPQLEATLDKYLATVEPLVTPEEFKLTKVAVEEFKKGDGMSLHKELCESDSKNKGTSYISEPWFDMYLRDRQPLPINYNPQITFNDDPARGDQALRAASLIHAALRFQNSLVDEVLYPDVFHTQPDKSKTPLFDKVIRMLPDSISFYGAYLVGAYPLDMSQYKNLFCSTRIPKKGKDTIKASPSAEHVIVIRNNRFFKLPVRDASGKIATEGEILKGLQKIIQDSGSERAPQSIGVLTTENRDTWAELREELHQLNKESLETLDQGVFVVCLDQEKNLSPEALSRQLLLGDAKNRWFDKSFSLIVTGDGKAAVNFEHSWGDGVAVVRFMDEIFDAAKKAPVPSPAPFQREPKELTFKLSDKLASAVKAAEAKYRAACDGMDLKILQSGETNKEDLKKLKVSPDGFLQMSFQLAYWKLYQKTVTTYESASTAAFKHGRTEAIRPATALSKQFTQAFSGSASEAEKNKVLREAIKYHSKISVDAMTGNGVDRHLFALRYLAQKKGLSTPQIFQDKAYQTLNNNILSTSTLTSPAIALGGFGPVAKDGYGIAYGARDDSVGFNVTAFKDVKPFLDALDRSIKEMSEVLRKNPPSSSS